MVKSLDDKASSAPTTSGSTFPNLLGDDDETLGSSGGDAGNTRFDYGGF